MHYFKSNGMDLTEADNTKNMARMNRKNYSKKILMTEKTVMV